MGCDIHPAIEVNVWAGDKNPGEMWDLVAVPDRDRCYAFFGHIAGVRKEDAAALWEDRGVPPKMDYMSEEIVEKGDHSHTWWTLSEMEMAPPPEADDGIGPTEIWDRWLRIMRFYRDEYGVTSKDVRVVVSFDN